MVKKKVVSGVCMVPCRLRWVRAEEKMPKKSNKISEEIYPEVYFAYCRLMVSTFAIFESSFLSYE